MKKSKKEILWYLPIIYFLGLATWTFTDNVINERTHLGSFFLPTLVLLALILTKNYTLQILTGTILLLWSGLIVLAYISDITKIIEFDQKAINFLFYGGIVTLLNLLMSILLLINDLYANRKQINLHSAV